MIRNKLAIDVNSVALGKMNTGNNYSLNLDVLSLIPTMMELMLKLTEKIDNTTTKEFLSTEETAQYTSYSKDSIDSFVKKGELALNVHYYQKGKKRMFNRQAIDKWVMGIDIESDCNKTKIEATVEEIISSLKIAS